MKFLNGRNCPLSRVCAETPTARPILPGPISPTPALLLALDVLPGRGSPGPVSTPPGPAGGRFRAVPPETAQLPQAQGSVPRVSPPHTHASDADRSHLCRPPGHGQVAAAGAAHGTQRSASLTRPPARCEGRGSGPARWTGTGQGCGDTSRPNPLDSPSPASPTGSSQSQPAGRLWALRQD